MNDEPNQGKDRTERQPGSTPFSPTRIAATGVASAIILLIVMIVIFLAGQM